MIRTILLTCVFVLFASMAVGEYYQYTDETGNLRFTDDLYQVPEVQRPAMQKFESVKSVPDDTTVEQNSVNEEIKVTVESDQPESSPAVSGDTGDTFHVRAAELNKMQSELNKTRVALEKEQAAIEALAPKKDAKSKERIAYSAKVDALNAKIEKYGKDLKAFEEKVNAFNNRKKR